jgi:isochorismate pyruvate lyase
MGHSVTPMSLDQVREEIDQVDRELVQALARRKALVERAARIKQFPRNVADEDRNEEVLSNVRASARELGLPERFVERVWRLMTQLWIRHQIDLLVNESGESPYRGGEGSLPDTSTRVSRDITDNDWAG